MEPPGPDPTPCLSTNLRMAARAATRLYDDALRPAGLRSTQFAVLSRLAGGPATVARLAARLGMDRTTLARDLGPLERDGLVEVAPGEDRRERVVSLTPEGRRRVRRVQPLWEEAQARLRGELGGRRADALLEELRAVAGAARALGHGAGH